jgi:hypothetical protein
MASTPRSIRNNNPGNIRVGDPWRGLATRGEMTPEQKAEKAFCVFVAPKWGFRAMAVVLMAYQDRHNLMSIGAMIDRWAPPNENNTAGYIARVGADLGIGRDTPVDVQDWRVMRPLVEAIARVESGGAFPWSDAEVDEGLKLAGIVKAQASAVRDPAVLGGAGLTAAGVVTVVNEGREILESAKPIAEAAGGTAAVVLGAGVVLAVIGFIVWRLVLRRRKVEAT